MIQVANRDFVDSQVLSASGSVTKGADATIDGHKCVTLKTKTGTLYLDASSALPVQVSGTGGTDTGKARFSYEKLTAPTAPAANDQVDLNKLVG